VSQGLVSLLLRHDGLALVAEGDFVAAAADEQVRVGEPEKGDCVFRSRRRTV
jgi:hypothetical protein